MDFSSFLTWLVTGGGSIMAASWILGRFPKYAALADSIKQIIFFCVASVFGVGAYFGMVYLPPTFIAQIQPIFVILAGVFAYTFFNKLSTKLDAVQKLLELKK